MKLSLFLAAAPTAFALQGNYLSQLGGGVATSTGGNFFPSPTVTGGMGEMATTSSPDSGSTPSQELLDLWSAQVSVELSASQLYLSASIWFRERGMSGMAAWMLDESGEERGHGLAILEHAMQKGFPVRLEPLNAPRFDWQNEVQVWEDILNAEQTNTQNLLNLAAAADRCGQYGCMAFLNDFHIEQIEAEETVGGILNKVRSGNSDLLMQLDYDLGKEAEEEDHH